jgi:hypothetical protein
MRCALAGHVEKTGNHSCAPRAPHHPVRCSRLSNDPDHSASGHDRRMTAASTIPPTSHLDVAPASHAAATRHAD